MEKKLEVGQKINLLKINSNKGHKKKINYLNSKIEKYKSTQRGLTSIIFQRKGKSTFFEKRICSFKIVRQNGNET